MNSVINQLFLLALALCISDVSGIDMLLGVY